MFGGVNIEEVFKSSPDSIYTDPIDITKGSLIALLLTQCFLQLSLCVYLY